VGGGGKGRYVPIHLREGARLGPGGGREFDEPSLRISNLPMDTTEDDLRELFSRFGRVSRVYLAKDKDTGQSRGFAFLNFFSRADAQCAMEKLDRHRYGHLILQVEWARPRERDGERQPGGGGGGGLGGGGGGGGGGGRM
jgi:translation initiation factor 3 subunit G